MKTPLMLLLAICIGILTVTGTASSSELTPQQRALIFSKPKSVRALKKGVATISLEGTDQRGFYKCPYMHVYINGEGPFTFLFDTGSAFTVVSSKVVAKARIQLALDRGGYHDLLRVKKINVGELEIQDLIGVRDDDFGVDGVFGFKAFGDMNLVFRLADRQLVVSEKPVPLPDSFALPFKLDRNLPTIPVTVGTAQVPTLIDTGDDAYAWEIRSSDLTGAGLAHPPVPAGQVLNGAKQQTTFVSTLGSPVRLGPIVIDDAVVCINDGLPVPDFGVDFLKGFNIEFEPKRMLVRLQSLSPTSKTRIRGNLSPGFTLRFDDLGTVSDVVPGSAADRYGMRSGDKILSIDGRSIRGYKPRDWDEALSAGKPLAVRWLNGTKEHLDNLAVEEAQ